MIGIFLFFAAIVWAIWVMCVCVVAVILFFVQMVLEGVLALSNWAERETEQLTSDKAGS